MKKFLIINNINAACYKDVFPYIKRGEMWLGLGKEGMNFLINGEIGKVSTACWFTNLDNLKYKKPLNLVKRYSPEAYPRYDNFPAIEVSKTKNIPLDYTGVMGVPLTFLFKYHPAQFEIVGGLNDYKEADAEAGLLIGEDVTYTEKNGRVRQFRGGGYRW